MTTENKTPSVLAREFAQAHGLQISGDSKANRYWFIDPRDPEKTPSPKATSYGKLLQQMQAYVDAQEIIREALYKDLAANPESRERIHERAKSIRTGQSRPWLAFACGETLMPSQSYREAVTRIRQHVGECQRDGNWNGGKSWTGIIDYAGKYHRG